MTTLNEAKEAVYARFVAQFTGVAADRVAFDNEAFEEPDTGDWVRLTVRHTGRAQETLGGPNNRKFRSFASVLVQVYTEANTGVQQSDALAAEVRGIFEAVSFSGLAFYDAAVRETGPDGQWYQAVVEAEFDYEEIK